MDSKSDMESTCLEVRRELMTQPKSRESAIMQHLSSCNVCADYLTAIKLFDNKLAAALHVEVPEGLESRILLAQRMSLQDIDQGRTRRTSNRSNYSWMSLAAGIVLAIGLSIGLYKLGESHGVERDVLAHVYEDLYALDRDDNIRLTSLNNLLKPHGIQAKESIGYIRYASNCPIDDKIAPHFILDDKGKAITVMYIPWENVSNRIPIDDKRFKGILVGSAQGSFVILSEDQEVLANMEHRVMSSVEIRI
ncbi:MAG: DUF3379 family protein [Gammaproteobacteria bacterium]|jgi:hypothetical protein|nr:DUF3379 family protein [Gammaproteobacteria bacterium]